MNCEIGGGDADRASRQSTQDGEGNFGHVNCLSGWSRRVKHGRPFAS
jgi:hypothetical protein